MDGATARSSTERILSIKELQPDASMDTRDEKLPIGRDGKLTVELPRCGICCSMSTCNRIRIPDRSEGRSGGDMHAGFSQGNPGRMDENEVAIPSRKVQCGMALSFSLGLRSRAENYGGREPDYRLDFVSVVPNVTSWPNPNSVNWKFDSHVSRNLTPRPLADNARHHRMSLRWAPCCSGLRHWRRRRTKT